MIRLLARDTVVYGLGQVSQQLLAFLTLPIFARMLSPDDFGILETLTTLTTVIGMVASLSLDSAMQRRYFDYSAEQLPERRRVLVTTMLTVLAWEAGLFLLLWPVAEPIMQRLQGGPGSGQLLLVALATQFLTIPFNLLRDMMRLQRRPWTYTGLSIAQGLLWMACGLYFVYARHAGVMGYLLGGGLAVLLVLPLAYWPIRQELTGRFDRTDLREMVRFALPMLPAAMTFWMMTLADRLILNHWVDLTQIGYYGIGQKMTRLTSILFMAFGTAWGPFVFGLYAEDPEREKQVRTGISSAYFAVLAMTGVLLTGLAPELITLLVSDRYLPAVAVVGPLCLGTIGSGISQLFATGISLAKETRYFAIYTAVASLLNVGLNFLLVPTWGIVGSAWATALGFVVLNVAYYRTSQRIYPSPYPAGRLIRMALLTLVTIPVLGMVPSLALRLAMIAGFLPVAALIGALDVGQLRYWRQQARTWWQARRGSSAAQQ